MRLLAVTTDPTWFWYFTRATGVVALVLLSTVLVLGLLGPLRVRTARWPRFAIETVHRDVSLIALVLITMHVVTAVLDGFAPITLWDGIVPFLSPYRPLWLGLGALAFDLMLAVIATSLVRRRIGYAAWRWIHWLAYASWPVAVLHGLGTGSDAAAVWGLALTAGCVAAVAGAVIMRLSRASGIGLGVRRTGVAAAVALVLALVVFTDLGPLGSDWAAHAGTPKNLLAEVGR